MSLLKEMMQPAVNRFRQFATKSVTYPTTNGIFWGSSAGTAGRNQDLTQSPWGALAAYSTVIPVYRSVNLRAAAVESVEWRIVDIETEKILAKKGDARTTNPLARAINEVRITHSTGLFYMWEQAISLYGEFFAEKSLNEFDYPRSIWPLNNLGMIIDIQQGVIVGFRYSYDSKAEEYYPAEVVFDRTANPGNDLRGWSPTYTAIDIINLKRNINRGSNAFFRNGILGGGLITPEGESLRDPKEVKRIRDYFAAFQKGTSNAGRWVVSTFGAKLIPFDNPDFSKQLPLNDSTVTEIYSGYGVSRPVAGDTDSTRFQSSKDVLNSFKAGVVVQEVTGIADVVNTDLMPFFDPTGRQRFEFVTDGFDTISDSDKTKADEARKNLDTGAITYNEFRQIVGMEEVDGGDVYKRQSGMIVVDNLSGRPEVIEGTAIEETPLSSPEPPPNGSNLATGSIAPAVEVDKELVLNGAQITSALQIVDAVAAGELPRESGINMLTGFFSMDSEQAENIMGEVGLSFVVAPKAFKIRAVLLSQDAVNYTMQAPGHEYCEGCRWFIYDNACQIIQAEPESIVPGGVCDRWENENPTTESTKADDDAAIFVSVPLQHYPEIGEVQDQLSAHIGEDGIDYQAPDTFHITMVYCGDSVEDEALEELLEAMETPAAPVGIRSSSLIELGHTGSRAICMEVEKTKDLIDWQGKLCGAFNDRGLELSPFSAPDKWVPHITLAYVPDGVEIPELDFEVEIDTDGLSVSNGDYEEIARWEDSARKIAAYTPKAKAELKAWQKFLTNSTKRPFNPEALRGDLGDWIIDSLKEADGDSAKVKAVFTESEERLSFRHIDSTKAYFLAETKEMAIKAISDTEKHFDDTFSSFIEKARTGKVNRTNWSATTRRFIRGFGKTAFIDGMNDGGVIAEEGAKPDSIFDDSDRDRIASLSRSQSRFVTSLGKTLFTGDGLSKAQVAAKAAAWWARSIMSFYHAGLASAGANPMVEMVGTDGIDHPGMTCKRLKGQRHKRKTWARKNLIPQVDGDSYECGGFNCQHTLEEVKARARGRWLRDAPGKWS